MNNDRQSKHHSAPIASARRIADLSDDDKPREKALRNGIRSLSDTELLAILLGGGIPGKSVIELSRELYDISNRSLSDLARMSVRDMCKRIAGIGPAKAITVAAALELGARRKDLKVETRPRIRSSADAYELIRNVIQDLATEEFWIIMLSRANMVIATTCISSGGTAATVVDPKIIMKLAIEHLASSIILVHNHPSGNLKPSVQDDDLTQKIKSGGQLLDINVLDHLIIATTGYYSYADESRI